MLQLLWMKISVWAVRNVSGPAVMMYINGTKKKRLAIAAYPEECVECYQCMYYCPSGAITVEAAQIAFYDPLYDRLGLND